MRASYGEISNGWPRSRRISTLPEFLDRRYSSGSQMVLAFMVIAAAWFIHIGMSLYALAAVFKHFSGSTW